MNLLSVLPLAFVMIAGPQIITAVFLAASRDAKRSSLAFLVGAGLAVLVTLTVWYVIFHTVRGAGNGPSRNGGTRHVINWLTLLLLASPLLALLAFGQRADAVLPKVRNWANDHSWLVSEAALLIFVAIIVSDLL